VRCLFTVKAFGPINPHIQNTIVTHYSGMMPRYENGYSPCTTHAMDFAAKNGHVHVVQGLHHRHDVIRCAVTVRMKPRRMAMLFFREHRGEGWTQDAIADTELHLDIWTLCAIYARRKILRRRDMQHMGQKHTRHERLEAVFLAQASIYIYIYILGR
jgi:hypothetical protein